ncbi:polyprenyl synthetase family protein [Stieleria sp. ICT_E10.1]|uniref:polyprenyl synthetase family protein n=1 Tax=Stieleria sedimenti TaxID=2976331 RepID=UPI00217FA4EE|nr:polyprenyl synthetase family protein [Stieleria sedimenti]MCS7465914.1 polyprenyl synthetase family protein [Stieleria sedimenti]
MDASETFRDRSDTVQVDTDSRVGGNRNGVPQNGSRHPPPTGDHPVRGSKNSAAPSANPLLQRLYGPISKPLAGVEATLRSQLQSPFEGVSALLRHGVALGGKRLRPAVHLLMAEALGGVKPSNITIGAVLEMVHTATLVHDDVLDEAATRRHVPTINAQWNNHTSILLGDYLFAQSFQLAATLDNTRTCQWVGQAARLVCEGELRQVLGRGDLEIERETYFEIIQGKTAELCRVACSLAAAEAGCDAETTDRLADYGNSLGIAFQIADDFLDLWGDDEAVGKTLGTDLEQGKITLPIIRLLETANPERRDAILTVLNGPSASRISQIRTWLDQSDAREFTVATAAEFKQRALDAIADLPTGAAKNCLIEIAEFSIQRSF